MTLRTRLTAAFLAVVLGPVLLGAVFVGATVATVSRDRSVYQLDLASSATRSAVAALCQQLRTTAQAVAAHRAGAQPAVADALVGRDLATAVRILDADDRQVAITSPAPPLPWVDCANPGDPPRGAGYGAIAARAPITGDVASPGEAAEEPEPEARAGGEVWAAAPLDEALVDRLAAAAGAAVTLLDPADPTTPLHSTEQAPGQSIETASELGEGEVGETQDGRWVRRLDLAAGQPLPLVVSVARSDPQGLYALLTALVALAGLLAVGAAWRLARSTTRPLAELAQAADEVADGDLSVRVPVRAGDEAGRLAASFNRMTHRTQSYVHALTASRDQLRRQLSVLGDTLSSTHDLDRILRVILRTAVAATGARAGAVVLIDQTAGTLTGHATVPPAQPPGPSAPLPPGGSHRPESPESPEPSEPPEPSESPESSESPAGADEPWKSSPQPPPERLAEPDREVPVTVPLGEGLLGEVAASGEARRGRVTADAASLHAAEPQCRTYIVVPISAPGGVAAQAAPWPAPPTVRGVLALYDRLGMDEFDDTDLVTLRTFASQAAVAVDNVHTHEEAQRLSMTDPLTGLWNYRSLRESMRREVERASRFNHTLAVLTLDLDRFKDVNDVYGHPAGDAVLVEFAGRIRSAIREVDLAFRQGGEEFVVLLPETDAHGATVLAHRLGAAVRDEPVAVTHRGPAEHPIRITVSIGIAVYPDHALTPQAVLDAADDALYAAKAAGRDTYRLATTGPVPVAAAELPVRASARTPDGDLPHAGSPGGDGGRAGGDSLSPGGAPSAPGGAQPPRQTRGR